MKQKKLIKYLALTIPIVAIGGYIVTGIQAKATVGGRGSVLGRVLFSCFGGRRGNLSRASSVASVRSSFNQNTSSTKEVEELNNPLLNNVDISEHLKVKASNMLKNNSLVGATIEEFEVREIDDFINHNHFYHQNKTGDTKITLSSIERPLIIDVNKDGTQVTTSYKDANGQEKSLLTFGMPSWILGKDVFKEEKKRSKESVQRYFQSMEGVTPDNYYGLDIKLEDSLKIKPLSSSLRDEEK